MTTEQLRQLADYLQTHLCLTSKQVAHYVQHTWQVTYTQRAQVAKVASLVAASFGDCL